MAIVTTMVEEVDVVEVVAEDTGKDEIYIWVV
jgi:hypothetical protein